MNLWICFSVLCLVPFVLSSRGDSLLEPCGMHDIECLSRSTEQFLEKTCRGIEAHDIKPIDPWIYKNSLTHVVDEKMGLVLHFTNLNVTGLRNQKISDFQMDTDAKSVVLKTKAALNIVGDITIEVLGQPKKFTGVYHASGSVLGTARYNYELTKDDKDVEHFIVGPENTSCEAIEGPVVSLNQELQNEISKDPITAAKESAYTANQVAYRKAAVCHIAQVAYKDVVHNIRAAAKILPKSAFFKDV